MRTFVSKVLTLILINFIFVSMSFDVAAATGAGEPAAGAAVAAPALPPLDLNILRNYMPPADNASLAARLDKISVVPADIYGAVACEFAYKVGNVAENRTQFHALKTSGAPLEAANLESLGVPALFAGWRVVGVLDTIGEEGVMAAEQTDLFALTLQSKDGFRLTAVRGTDQKSAHNLIADLGIMANSGDVAKLASTVWQKRHPYAALTVGAAVQLLPKVDLLGPVKAFVAPHHVDAAVAYVSGRASEAAIAQAVAKLEHSVHVLDEYLRSNISHAVVGHSLGGILANSILRSRELMGGDVGAMAKGIQYIGSFAGMGTQTLIPSIVAMLNGGPREYGDSALCGANLARYREIYRPSDAVGGSRKHIGTSVKLESALPVDILKPVPVVMVVEAAAAVAVAVIEPAAAGGAGASAASAFTYMGVAWGACTATATAVSTAAGAAGAYAASFATDPLKAILADHSCGRMMDELLMAYAHQNRATIADFLAAGAARASAAGAIA